MPSPNNEENGTTDGNEERKYLESLSARIAAQADKLKAVTSFIWSLYRIHQFLMIGFKLDSINGRKNWNWWGVFWPTYVVSCLLGMNNPNHCCNVSSAILKAILHTTCYCYWVDLYIIALFRFVYTTDLWDSIAQNYVTVHDWEEIPCLC